MLGFKLKPSKSYCGSNVTFLGVDISGGKGPVTMDVSQEKKEKYMKLIEQYLRKDRLAPADAESLAGKLNFGSYSIWGRAPRVFLVQIYQRAAQKGGAYGVAGTPLWYSLKWWASFLRGTTLRALVRPSPHVGAIVHTDASLSAIGVVILLRGLPARRYRCPVPSGLHIKDSDNKIFILELYAALAGVRALGRVAKEDDRPNTFLFIDNNSSLVTLLKGCCNKSDHASVVISNFWREVDSLGIHVWLERIRSGLNWADAPSRVCNSKYIPIPFPHTRPM